MARASCSLLQKREVVGQGDDRGSQGRHGGERRCTVVGMEDGSQDWGRDSHTPCVMPGGGAQGCGGVKLGLLVEKSCPRT